MQFRDLKEQYRQLKPEIDQAIHKALADAAFISGPQVRALEERLASYVGVRYCISCANGTDALSLALMAWNIGSGDAVFVPDFTFFASGETVSYAGAEPVFVDVERDTYNLSPQSLEEAIAAVMEEGKLTPKAIVAVDLFGQPANYPEIRRIAEKYNLYLLEDGAQGFGGSIGLERACSFADIATTSFFPAKPLGCYGDGGAIFTNNEEWARLIRSYCVHGKGSDKYDNVRIGVNSRLDTIQAAILQVKLDAFEKYELQAAKDAAALYTRGLRDVVETPETAEGYASSWAQYTIRLKSREQRDSLQRYLKEKEIPSMIYYKKPMHTQEAFRGLARRNIDLSVTESLCESVLSLPMHPYLRENEIQRVISEIHTYFS